MFRITIEGKDFSTPLLVRVGDQEITLAPKNGPKTKAEDLKIIKAVMPEKPEQMALLPIESVEKETSENVGGGFFTIGYGPAFEAIRKIIACGKALEDKDCLVNRNDIKIKCKNKKMLQALMSRRGISLRVFLDGFVSQQGDKPLTDGFIYLSKMAKEQCWDGRDFVNDVVTLSPQNYKACMQFERQTDAKDQLVNILKTLKQIRVSGVLGQDTTITKSGKSEPLVLDFWPQDGKVCVKLDSYMWQLLTAQELVLPWCLFAKKTRKTEANLMFNIFSEIKEYLPSYAETPKKFSVRADHLFRKGCNARLTHRSTQTQNKRFQELMENVKRIFVENRNLMGVSIDLHWDANMSSPDFLSNSGVEIAVPKRISAYYKDVVSELDFGRGDKGMSNNRAATY